MIYVYIYMYVCYRDFILLFMIIQIDEIYCNITLLNLYLRKIAIVQNYTFIKISVTYSLKLNLYKFVIIHISIK